VSIRSQPAVSVIVVKSRDDVGSAYVGIERGVIIIGVTAIGLVLAGGLWWSRRLTTA
jgi:hypothetical protein